MFFFSLLFLSSSPGSVSRAYLKRVTHTVALQPPKLRAQPGYRMPLVSCWARESLKIPPIVVSNRSSTQSSMCTYKRLAVATRRSCKFSDCGLNYRAMCHVSFSLSFFFFSVLVGVNRYRAVGRPIKDKQCWNRSKWLKNTKVGSMR